MVEFSMYYDIFLKSWKTKENLDPIPAKSLWTRSGMYFGIIITRTAPRRPTAIGSFVISNISALKSIRAIWAKSESGSDQARNIVSICSRYYLHIMLFLPPKRPIYNQITPSF